MSSIIARRRHPAAGYAAVAGGLVVFGVLYGTLSGGGRVSGGARPGHDPDLAGSCAVHHQLLLLPRARRPGHVAGAEPDRRGCGRGGLPDVDGPHARQGTGRGERPQAAGGVHRRRRSTTSPPTSPRSAAVRRSRRPEQVSTSGADTALGSELFSTNCAQCHGFAGAGGALTYGKNAPSLNASTPTQIYEAMLTGPEAMPVFGDGTITPGREAGHHRLHRRDAERGQPRRLLARPDRHDHRGPARLARRARLPRAHRHVAHRQAAGPPQGRIGAALMSETPEKQARPICSMRAWFITTTRSATSNASSWSCVTKMLVT